MKPESYDEPSQQSPAEKPTHDQIAVLAYQFYCENGHEAGRDMEHWLRAEQSLRQRPVRSNHEANVRPVRSEEVPPVVRRIGGPLDAREYPFARDERGSASREEVRRQQIPPAARQSQRRPERST